MNINCTSKCAYQDDGKCTMAQVPDINGISLFSAALPIDTDCPYINLT